MSSTRSWTSRNRAAVALGAIIGLSVLAHPEPVRSVDPGNVTTQPLRTATKIIDPCAFGTPDQLSSLISAGIGAYFPVKRSKDGDHVTISEPRLTDLRCPGCRVALRSKIRYQKTRGFPQFSTSGEVRLASPLVARVTYSPGAPPTVHQAAACLTSIDVTGLNLNNVPNWLDSTWIKQWLDGQLANRMCFDVTTLVRLWVQQGGTL